jgi:hypothetical protein
MLKTLNTNCKCGREIALLEGVGYIEGSFSPNPKNGAKRERFAFEGGRDRCPSCGKILRKTAILPDELRNNYLWG